MDPFVTPPAYTPPGQVYAGPQQPKEGINMNVVQQMIQEEIRKLNASLNVENNKFKISLANQEQEQKNLRKDLNQMKIQAEEDRIGGTRAEQELRKLKAFASKITPVPPQEQLTVLERDQLDFFLKSPGIGMLFLSTAFYLAKTDLGGQLKSAVAKALGPEEIKDVGGQLKSAAANALGSEGISTPDGTDLRRASDAVLKTVSHNAVLKTVSHKLLKPARVCLTIVMPLLLLGVQFAYIFFIFKEGYDNYSAGVCPGYDVPDKIRHDPGLGADTQVRILVGFVGGYFVFRNISQLISYQRALRGNTKLDKFLKAAGIMDEVVSEAAAFESAVTSLNNGNTVGVSGSSMGQDAQGTADTSTWKVQDVTKSDMYLIYCFDIFFNLSLVFLVLLCNLYVVFVEGAGAQDVVTKVVILDFILVQQTNFKREIFNGNTGRVVLHAIKVAYESTSKPESEALTKRNERIHNYFGRVLLVLGQIPIFLSIAFIMYGPICKPGISSVGSLDIKTGGSS